MSPVLTKAYFPPNSSSNHAPLICFSLQRYFSKRYIQLLSPIFIIENASKKIRYDIIIKILFETCQAICVFKDGCKVITKFRIVLTCCGQGDCFWEDNGASTVLVVFGYYADIPLYILNCFNIKISLDSTELNVETTIEEGFNELYIFPSRAPNQPSLVFSLPCLRDIHLPPF